MACNACKVCEVWKVCKMCAMLVLCLLHVVAPLNVPTSGNVVCAFSGWVPPEGYVPRRLRHDAQDISKTAPKTCKTLRAPFRPWRQGIPWRQDRGHLRQKVCTQRQEIAGLRTHMSALQLEAELRDFWCKEFKEVRYVGNDTFVVAYTLRL